MYRFTLEAARRRARRIAALGGVALALLVSAVPAQAASGHGGGNHNLRGHKVA